MRLLIICLALIFLFITPLYAQNSGEIIFNDFYNCINNNKVDNSYLAIEYSIELLKNFPNSLESFYTIALMERIENSTSASNKFKELKDKYYSDISNIELNLSEKIILIELIIMGFDTNSSGSFDDEYQKCKEILLKIKDRGNDNNYSAIATLLLMSDKDEKDKCIEFFFEKFPNHPCIPIINLFVLSNYYVKKDFEKCIEESKRLIKEYDKIVSPFGWRLIMDYYNLMVFCYISLNDFENAKFYCDNIEKEAPTYDNLKQLKKLLKNRK